AQHCVVDARTIIMNLLDGRPAQRAAVASRVHRPDRLVIRVEDPVVSIVDRHVIRQSRPEDESLEKPRRVPQMPLRRARLLARLHDLILDGEPFREAGGLLAYGAVPLREKVFGSGFGGYWLAAHVRGLETLAIPTFVQSLCQRDANWSGTLSATLRRGAMPASKGANAMKRAIVLFSLLISAAGVTTLSAMLSACNTVEGVGRDIDRAGDAIQDEADDTRDRRRRN